MAPGIEPGPAPPDVVRVRYPYSWLPAEDASGEARELADRGPEAFAD
jgi:hypothetical protein